MKLADAAQQLNLTYRKADYWARTGLIEVEKVHRPRPETPSRRQAKYTPKPITDDSYGSGYIHTISDHEFEVLRLLTALVDAGMNVTKAAPIARALAEDPARPVAVGSVTIGVRG